MTDKKSSEMDEGELYDQHFLCPDCGRQGFESGKVANKNFELTLIDGLDLANCKGCIAVLAARGGGPIGQVSSDEA
jgi:hypothetical protein